MTKIKRLVAVVLALMMIFGSVSIVASAWDATTDDGFALNVTTKIFRQVDGEWIETTKVKAGETVKARVYLGTDYFTNGGDLLFFYNTSFFEDSYSGSTQTLSVNPLVYTGGNYGITGTFYNSKSPVNIEGRLINLGVIDQDFADKHNYFAVSFALNGNNKNNLLLASDWLCEFDLKVKADASASDSGDLFARVNTFRSDAVKDNYCNVSKGPSFAYNEDVVDMTNWNANITVASQPVTLYSNYVEATFDANGGLFAGDKATKVAGGEAGTALNVGTPVYEGFNFAGWVAAGSTDVLQDVVALPSANTTYVAQWKSATDLYNETLGFRTEIFRQNDDGEWVFTEKVIPGETVKARIYIDTTYYTNAGEFVVFYDNAFFEEVTPLGFYESVNLATNDSATSSAYAANASGNYNLVSNDARAIKKLLNANLVDQEFVNEHSTYLVTYSFNPTNSAILSGNEYFAEWELKVKDTASGEGDFFTIEEAIQNTSPAGKQAYTNIPVSYEGGTDDDAISLFEINVNTDVESNPVTTLSAINFDANGGAFATGETTFVINGDIADPVDAASIPEVTLDGYTFAGWVPADVAEPTKADVVEVPSEIPFDELFLKALWINEVKITIDPSNGDPIIEETVSAGADFVKPEAPTKEGNYLAGWVDGEGNFMTELPDKYPEEDTTYTAVFEPFTYIVEYFVLNSETLNFDSVAAVNTAYGAEILAVPPTYTVPEGFTLSAAYTDVSLSKELAAGATMPAENVQLYYRAVANEYPATFKLDGGNIDGDTSDVVIETVYGQQIKTPADPVKEGHTFAGWDPMVGMMDSEGAEFVAVWDVNDYTATYIVDGAVYEAYDIPFGGEMETPAAPVKAGYNFVGWDPAPIPATMPAEDLTFTAVFEEKDITITLNLAGGTHDGSADDIVLTGKYGSDIPAVDEDLLAKEGYVFGGWEPALPATYPTEDAEYTAIWNPAKDTAYQVWVYLENTDGSFPADDNPNEVINMTGETDAVINVAVPTPYGFVLNETKGDVKNEVTIAPDGSTVYKVYYDRVKYAITFDGNGGTIAGEPSVTSEYRYLASVTAPADADLVKEGHTFIGWAPAVDSEATKAVTYVAQWEVNSYDVNYMIKAEDIKDATEDELFKSETFNYGDPLTVTADKPEKTGYSFNGWVDANGATYKFPATMPAEDITVYAKFTARNYEAKFFEEPDSAAPFDITNADFDMGIELPASEPTKEGYEFGGWADAEGNAPAIMDEEGKDFYAIWNAAEQEIPVEYYYMDTDGTYPAAADKTEYVKFKTDETATVVPADVDNYTVDADKSVLESVVAADGSTVLKVYYKLNSTKLTIEVDGKETVIEGLVGSEVPADKIPDTEKDGYTFNGWVDENGDPAEVPTTMPEEDTTIKADYTVNSYNVTYFDGNVVYDGPTATEFGTPIAEPSIPTKVGYAFTGWLDDAGKKPSDYGVMPSTDLEFYAQWVANANIGYVLEAYEMGTDGTYPSTPTTIYNFSDGVVDDIRTVTVEVPTGFTLDVETTLTPEKSELTGKIPATGTLVLKAYFTRNQYTLYVEVDGAIVDEETYYYQEEIADREDPVKKGWSFTGWAPPIPVIMPAEDVTVVAQFTKNSYTATFNAGEGAFATGDKTVETDVPYAESITAPATNPTRDGYEFKGWSTDGTNVIDNLGKMDDKGKEFIAVWEKAEVTVTFYNFLPSEKGPEVPEGQATYVYEQKNYLFGETVVFPADPVVTVNKNGESHTEYYIFTGWVDADGNAVAAGITAPAENLDIYATYDRVPVMLIPKNDTCTTVIDRAGLTVDDYTADSEWYVYGLEEILSLDLLLNEYIDVQGDGTIKVTKIKDNSNYYGTGSLIEVYDNVTGELVESFRIIIYGDVDGDSKANAVDLSIISDEVFGVTWWSIPEFEEYRAYKLKAADLYGDGIIDNQDKSIHNKYDLGIGELNQVEGVVEF